MGGRNRPDLRSIDKLPQPLAIFPTEGRARIGNGCPMMRRLVLVLVGLASCVRVQAHQREYLARPAMNPEAAPLERKLDTHVEEYREGSIGGAGVGGGGC